MDNYDKDETLCRLKAFDLILDPTVETCEKYCRRKITAIGSVRDHFSEADFQTA